MTSRLTNLIADLEKAMEGRRELDARVAEAAGWRLETSECWKDGSGRPAKMWFQPDGREEHPNCHPHYTTSLDAKLPWENIVKVRTALFADGTILAWFAYHRPDGPMPVVYSKGKGKTEPLARRIAALRALADRGDG